MAELKNYALLELRMVFETTMGLGVEDCTGFENEYLVWYRNVQL